MNGVCYYEMEQRCGTCVFSYFIFRGTIEEKTEEIYFALMHAKKIEIYNTFDEMDVDYWITTTANVYSQTSRIKQ